MNRAKRNADLKAKYHTDPNFKLYTRMAAFIRQTLQRKSMQKSQRTHEYLGCSLSYFTTEYWPAKIRAWNEAYPKHPISFENSVIHIDHIKPRALFNDDEMMQCHHYTNLQPLPAAVNNLKSDVWSEQDEQHWRTNIIFNTDNTAIYLPTDMPTWSHLN